MWEEAVQDNGPESGNQEGCHGRDARWTYRKGWDILVSAKSGGEMTISNSPFDLHKFHFCRAKYCLNIKLRTLLIMPKLFPKIDCNILQAGRSWIIRRTRLCTSCLRRMAQKLTRRNISRPCQRTRYSCSSTWAKSGLLSDFLSREYSNIWCEARVAHFWLAVAFIRWFSRKEWNGNHF